MSERKVLNKYYPPDFDPSKIPRMKLAKNRQYTVRLMAPFNMRCKTCGEYIYKGKKFNARKEDVEHETYLGIRIYRFYIKCTRCLQEISFKTDPQNTDYEIEAGATRNFMALKLAEEQAQREEAELREEEASNPMKLLENRTKQSRNEIELLESLEELHDLNQRQQTIDYDSMLQQYNKKTPVIKKEVKEEEVNMTEEQEEEYIKSVFKSKLTGKGKVVQEEIIEIKTDSTITNNAEALKQHTTAFDSSNVVNSYKRKQTMPLVKPKQRALIVTKSNAEIPITSTTKTNIESDDKSSTALAKTTTTTAFSSLMAYSGSSGSDDSE